MPLLAILVLALVATVAPARVQEAGTGTVPSSNATTQNVSEADEADARKNINRDFLGIRFGVGIGVSIDLITAYLSHGGTLGVAGDDDALSPVANVAAPQSGH